jgi:2-phosphosulfolactate phosphatase
MASPTRIDVVPNPAPHGDWVERPGSTDVVCVVIDVLRATSTIAAAFAAGAEAVIPVAEIAAAVAWRVDDPRVLLAGERDGLPIEPAVSGGVAFDFGNSPREMTPRRVSGRTIVLTTTNGTRAFAACGACSAVLSCSFANLRATADWLSRRRPAEVVVVTAGHEGEDAGEDVLCAGALCARLADALDGAARLSEAAVAARRRFEAVAESLSDAIAATAHGRELLKVPELRDDVDWCARLDTSRDVLLMEDGRIQRAGPLPATETGE